MRASTMMAAAGCAAALVVPATATAHPVRGARCHAIGRAPWLDEATDAPTVSARLLAGEQFGPEQVLDRAVEWQAYTPDGGRLQQFHCSARGGVDQWDAWRGVDTHRNRTFGRFDGATFTALRPVLFQAWADN